MLIYLQQFLEKIRSTFLSCTNSFTETISLDGERAVGKAAQKFNTMFGVSALATVSVEEIASLVDTPKCFSFIFIKIEA